MVCTATDAAGNIGTESFTVTVTAAWSNVLQPVNADGSSIFKLGSTVPVKFQLTGASAGITNLVRPPVPAAGRRRGHRNRPRGHLDLERNHRQPVPLRDSGQYIFNLNTKTLSAGTYQLRIDLGDGVLRTVNISLR